MKAIEFKEANSKLAEDQPEYNTLPVYFGQVGETEHHTGCISCYELTEDEINTINHTKQIWANQLTFGQAFQPFLLMVNSPFEDPKTYEKSTFDKSDLVGFGNMIMKNFHKREGLFGSEFLEVHESDIENYLESIKDE